MACESDMGPSFSADNFVNKKKGCLIDVPVLFERMFYGMFQTKAVASSTSVSRDVSVNGAI